MPQAQTLKNALNNLSSPQLPGAASGLKCTATHAEQYSIFNAVSQDHGGEEMCCLNPSLLQIGEPLFPAFKSPFFFAGIREGIQTIHGRKEITLWVISDITL